MRNRLSTLAALAIALLALLGGGPALAGSFEDGIGYFQGGHYRWALEKFVEAVDQAPRDSQRWWYLAESYRLLGDAAAAAPAYRQILRISPQTPLAASAYRALEAMGQAPLEVVQIPFQRRGGAILLPARINGESAGFLILDTGASLIALRSGVANRLGIRPSGVGSVRLVTANGVVRAPLAILEEVEIGGVAAKHVPAVIHEMPDMPPDIVGLLGMSFLERFQVNLDLSSGILILGSGR